MSGIVGILNRNGAPVTRALLQALTRFLDYRGPDARDVWTLGAVGFGHTMLRSTRESSNERQPLGLDGRFCITSDARLDCRAALIAKLENAHRSLSRTASDSELILHAYAAWNEECVHHLRGDFSFAIWDIRENKLFCARDHFGIKPFYYADAGDTFVFSNTLNCVRLHPTVSDELNDAAILDFLLIGTNWDNATTAFKNVRRLPPSHTLTISSGGCRLRRYWELPIDGRVRYRSEHEYLEHFRALLTEAVSDRMRTDRVGIFLSGGLDSSSIAATAHRLRTERYAPVELRGYTAVSGSATEDDEGPLAEKIGEQLEIPVRIYDVDELELFGRSDYSEVGWPELVDDPFFARTFDEFRMVAADCRTVFNGEGNDALMSFEMVPYVRDLWRQREWGRLVSSVLRFLRTRRMPMRGIWAWGQRWAGVGPLVPVLPNWISPSFATPSQVKARWEEITNDERGETHPVIPLAYASLSLPSWTQFFETNDPGVTHQPVEVRYPFLDLRIVEFLLAIPPFPWFYEKALLRRAMAGQLPREILRRPKTPLAEDPLVAQLQLPDAAAFDQMIWSEEIDRYVDRSAVPKLAGETSPEKARVGVRPHCLNFWLQYSRPLRYNLVAEAVNG